MIGKVFMKINIIYESQFGNGKKIVGQLSKLLKDKGQDVEVFSIYDISIESVPAADLYIFSSPTRKFMLPRIMGRFLKRFLPAHTGSKYALMTTYADPRTIALKKMDALLRSKDMQKKTEDFKVKVLGLKGPLEEGYEDKLQNFADALIS